MSVDTVQPSLRSQTVQPRQDAQDGRNPNSQHNGQSKQKDQQDEAEQHPVFNDLGHLTGLTINIVA